MAGYSGTPLPRKLGIKEGACVVLANAPPDFAGGTLGPLPAGATIASGTAGGVDVAVVFATSMAALLREFAPASRLLKPAGGLWIAWPKKASGIPTDLTENLIREVGLAAGLVDNKVCAIDETWSGLRFVIRLTDRKKT